MKHSLSVLPDITPAATVDVMGDFLSLMRARKEKSRPSRAIAKMIRGRGNMEPNRLGARKHQMGTTVVEEQEERKKVSKLEGGRISKREQTWLAR